MRIIAGSARGTKLVSPEGLGTRPTADRIKESLFNIIASDIYDCHFLDLFSGSGAIGIEALSRGANEVVFVDESINAYNSIKINIEKTKFTNKAIIIQMEVNKALTHLGDKNQQFDLIFMDPPYNKDIINNTIRLIVKYNLLAPNGFIMVERDSLEPMDHHEELVLYKEKKYGKTIISFLKGTENT